MTTAQWVVKVNENDQPADLATLQSWARAGRINRDSLVFHPVLARWGYVREFPEVNDHVQAPVADQRRYAAIACLVLALVCALAVGKIGVANGFGFVLVFGVVAFVVFAAVLFAVRK